MATMDWNIKAKYPGLRSILERVSDLSEVLAVHKDLASGLAQSLVANQLASAGTRVYKYAYLVRFVTMNEVLAFCKIVLYRDTVSVEPGS